MPEILLGREIIDPELDRNQPLLAAAHKAKLRATCLCSESQPELYIAFVNGRHIVRRMPCSGPDHATHCPTFDPPDGVSGLGPLMGSAISVGEEGHVDLKLDFALTLKGKRAVPPAPPSLDKVPAATAPIRKLTLTSLLHYFWSESGLTRWTPGMDGKRSWGLVRHLLREAAAGKTAKALSLADRLFLPETYIREKASDIARRREEFFYRLRPTDGPSQPVGLLVAEYKSHEQGRIGFKFTFRHMPDCPFYAEADLAGRFERAFEHWLRLADVTAGLHLVVIATFALTRSGYPTLLEIGMMPTSDHWIPIETLRDHALLQQLTGARRRFIKPMRFNLGRSVTLPTLLLTDAGPKPVRLYLENPDHGVDDKRGTIGVTPSGPLDAGPHNRPEMEVGVGGAHAENSVETADQWPLWIWLEGSEPSPLPPATLAAGRPARPIQTA